MAKIKVKFDELVVVLNAERSICRPKLSNW